MNTGRHRPQQDPFLGTADIISRVKLAQGGPIYRLLGAMRWPLVLAGTVLMAVLLLGLTWRVMGRPRLMAQYAAQKDLPQRASGVPGAQTQVARPPASPATSDVEGRRPVHPQVRVTLLHDRGAIWLDGARVADKKRLWVGRLAPGNHELSVRAGGQMMRLAFVVQQENLVITVDPAQQQFSVNNSADGRKLGRSR